MRFASPINTLIRAKDDPLGGRSKGTAPTNTEVWTIETTIKTTLTAMTSLLLVFALTGTAGGTLPETGPPDGMIPTGGPTGNTVGCDLSGEGYITGYGEKGVPSSGGSGDEPCTSPGETHSGDIKYSVLKVSRSGFTHALGYDWESGEFAQPRVACLEPASLLVDWTGDEPEATYLEGSNCIVRFYGTGEIADYDWYAFGAGWDHVKFVHTDSLADALVHLLA